MDLPSGAKRAITLPATAAVLALLGASSAIEGNGPKVTPVDVHFLVNEVTSDRRAITCTGQDGPYREVRQTFVGHSEALYDSGVALVADPNGTGTLVVRSKLLHKGTSGPTGFGTFSGTAYVISDATGTVTVVGKCLGATNGAAAGGLCEALVNGPNPATNGKLIANFDITTSAPDPSTGDPTTLAGTLGGSGSAEHPAVVVQGFCEQDADDTQEEVE